MILNCYIYINAIIISKWRNILPPFNGIPAAIIILLLATNPSYADYCDFSHLNFGVKQEELKKAFNINAMDIATRGEGIITTSGKEVCGELPEKTMVEILFLDNNFVQLSILSENISGELLTFATKVLGEQDNDKNEKKIIRALWKEDNKYSAIYAAYTEGRYDFEKLVITSSQHNALFDKQNKIDDVAADVEQQEEEKE